MSAYQATLFNCILQKRLPNLGKLWDGDIAVKHSNGAQFLVENVLVEQPRADVFEISPSGPIFGYKMRHPTGEMQKLEADTLAAEGVKPETFRKVAGFGCPEHGDRYACRWNCIMLSLLTWTYDSVLRYLRGVMGRWY